MGFGGLEEWVEVLPREGGFVGEEWSDEGVGEPEGFVDALFFLESEFGLFGVGEGEEEGLVGLLACGFVLEGGVGDPGESEGGKASEPEVDRPDPTWRFHGEGSGWEGSKEGVLVKRSW